VTGRRRAVYFYRDPKAKNAQGQIGGVAVELTLVNLILGCSSGHSASH
jgi:hypothetical protein